MPLLETKGAASAQGYGLTVGAAAEPVYVEDVMSTFLYTGNGSTQTITNGIDLAGKGGLVWAKERSNTGTYHQLRDTVRGGGQELYSNDTSGQGTSSAAYTFLSSGYSIGGNDDINLNTKTYASWTFRKAPKFFDVVTYTGNGTSQNIAHSLGSVPGCIIVKRTDDVLNWIVYHRTQGASKYGLLNTTNAFLSVGDSVWNSTEPTSSNFSVGTSLSASGGTYVAYLFAHNAGGFGLSGTDNVISCGSYATNSSFIGPNVNLGFEPAWILVKNASANGAWHIIDNMRGWTADGNVTLLNPNTSSAESTTTQFKLNATGFQDNGAFAGDATMIYIAIRRGPMRTPTTGTSVFAIDTAKDTTPAFVSGFPVDMEFYKNRTSAVSNWNLSSRLTGQGQLNTNNTSAEGTSSANSFDFQNGWGNGFPIASNVFSWMFRRAPGFFDEVCYTGNSDSRNLRHNLGVVPELAIVKCRDTATNWAVIYPSYIYDGRLNSSEAFIRTYRPDLTTRPWTTTTFSVGSNSDVNSIGQTYVAYLFASCPGVSKCGSYTGTGTTQTINCGFTAGARFVLIKRTDSTGDWYVWDSARGIVAGNDPYLLLNSTAAEVTSTDYVDTAATGFELSSTAPAAINASGGTFIFLAIA